MKLVEVILINYILHVVSSRNRSCGLDNSHVEMVYEGVVDVYRYPWMGMLYYPVGNKRVGSTVVLVTRQTCLTSAYEIDKMPKNDFRARARVVVGNPCGTNEMRVRDYSFHPDYKTNTFSALAMIQLETDHVKQELRPICPPPEFYLESTFFAMTMYAGCAEPRVKLYRMEYVDMAKCEHFYRKSDLDISSMWPTHTACARAISGGECLWRSGTVLAMKQNGRWRLLGFSVFGPGCGAPARFLDYGKYHPWVRRSNNNVGQPAVTRLAENRIIMRRTSSSIQRFGPCDVEETKQRLYSDRQKLEGGNYKVVYNLSLYTHVEYSCILFSADTDPSTDPFPGEKVKAVGLAFSRNPRIRIKRWCAGPPSMCYGFQYSDIHFLIEVIYERILYFNVTVFGREPKIISPRKAMLYQNKYSDHPPLRTAKSMCLQTSKYNYYMKRTNKWYSLRDIHNYHP